MTAPRPAPAAGAADEADPGHRDRGSSRRRLRWLVPALLVLLWVAVGAVGGPFAGRLADVAENDNAAFLPEDAESTVVAEQQRAFVDQETIPAIVVWESPDGTTPSVLEQATAEVAELQEVTGVVGQVTPPIPSEDGQALTVVVPLDSGLGEALTESVQEIRAIVGQVEGADVYVTGPGGVLGDFIEAFGGIDGILLAVALTVVLVILLVVYRSPLLPFVVLFSSLLALGTASLAVYLLADADVITLNGQSQGILFILVVGAATDYALLLVARFREELREERSRFDAIRVALRQAAPAIVASATTVVLGVLCLLVSDLSSNRGLGPVAAIGIVAALVVSLTFLPAALALLGRTAFWPFRPRFGSPHPEERGVWGKVGRLVERRPRQLWIGVGAALLVLAAFLPLLRADGVSQTDLFLQEVESKQGQEALARHFPAGSGSPAVVIAPEGDAERVVEVAEGLDGVDSARVATEQPTGGAGEQPTDAPPQVVDGRVQVEVTLSDAADSTAATQTVQQLRTALDEVSPDSLVGGQTAIQLDVQEVSKRDRAIIIPLVLLVILVVLVVLLRALVAPLLLVATVVLSFAATLGVSAIVFNTVFDWPGADPSVPLFGFVFLVALGIDYNIFLMTRVREESVRLGTRPGIIRGLVVTGGVITSAGLVLAATFSALGVIPILFLAQIAFIVAFGVLLDTIVVRSLLVPALAHDIGRRIWWPSRLARTDAPVGARTDEPAAAGRR